MKYDGYCPLSDSISIGYFVLTGTSIFIVFPWRTTVSGTLPSLASFWIRYWNFSRGCP